MEYEGAAWSPYLVGALIGGLSMATFYFSDKPLGVSTAYARLAGLVGHLFSKGHTETLKFYQEEKPKIDWEVMLLFGMILGAFIAAYTGGLGSGRCGKSGSGRMSCCAGLSPSWAARSWLTGRGSPVAAPVATASAEPCNSR